MTDQRTFESDEVCVSIARPCMDALDAYAADEGIDRPQAIRIIVADWLRTHGYKLVFTTKSTGPATEVVEAMDAAIKEHKRSKQPAKKG